MPSTIYAQFQTLCNNVDGGRIPTFVNQQNLIFDYNNNVVILENFDCDPCITGIDSQECDKIKACREKCSQLIPEDTELIIAECEIDCASEFPNDPHAYHHCLNYCRELPFREHRACVAACGGITNLRQPVSQETRIAIWYTTGFTTAPYYSGDPLYFRQFPISTFNTSTLIINLGHDFGNRPLSYCIQVITVVRYDDGSCCAFINQHCEDLG